MDKDVCYVCGTKRRRNLIISYPSKHGLTGYAILYWALHDQETAYKKGLVDKNVICFRCSMLGLSDDDIRIMEDRYFGTPKYRYRSKRQQIATYHYKENS